MDMIDPDPFPPEEDDTDAASLRRRAYRIIRDDPDRDARWARWRAENAAGMAAYNRWFEREGRGLINTSLL